MNKPMTDERLAELEQWARNKALPPADSKMLELVAEVRLSWDTGAKLLGVISKLQYKNAELGLRVDDLEGGLGE